MIKLTSLRSILGLALTGAAALAQAQVLTTHPTDQGKTIVVVGPDVASETRAAISRERVAYLDGDGTLWAHANALNAWARTNKLDDSPWLPVASSVQSFQMSPYDLVILKRSGELLWQQGDLSTNFTHIDRDVVTFQASGRRVGLLTSNGTFKVSTISGSPTVLATGVRRFHIAIDRIALLDGTDALWTSRASAPGKFDRVSDHVQEFQIDREWLAFKRNGGLFLGRAKDDAGGAPYEISQVGRTEGDFEIQAEGHADFRSTRLRLAFVEANGAIRVGTVGHLDSKPIYSAPSPLWSGLSLRGARGVTWAESTLFVTTGDGLVVVPLAPKPSGKANGPSDDWLMVGTPTALGGVKYFSPSAEGALLTQDAVGGLSLYRGINEVAKGQNTTGVARAGGPGDSRDLPVSSTSARTTLRLEIASEKPWFSRRATAASTTRAKTEPLIVMAK
jgi:hypothetical protein